MNQTAKVIIVAIITTYLCNVTLSSQNVPAIRPVVWLRADMRGKDPVTWEDASGNKLHATCSSVLDASKTINYNPSVDFAPNADGLFVALDEDLGETVKIFTVFCTTTKTDDEEFIWRLGDNTRQTLQLSNLKLYDGTKRYLYKGGQINQPLLSIVDKHSCDPSTAQTKLHIGVGADNEPAHEHFKGHIAEMLLFNRELSHEEQKGLNTYLSIKYGIAIIGEGYYNQAGQVLRELDEASNYWHNIFAIGRNDFYKLNQKQAISASEDMLAISAGDFSESNQRNSTWLQSDSYLFFADNGKEQGHETSMPSPGGGSYLLSGHWWKVDAVGKHTYRIPISLKLKKSALFTTIQGETCLVRDKNKNGKFTDIEIVKPDSTTGQNICYSDINFCSSTENTDYFTFAKISPLGVKAIYSSPACIGSDGGMIVQVTGGQPPYIFTLENESNHKIREWQNTEATQHIVPLSEGNYYLTVKDKLGYVYALNTGAGLLAQMPDLQLKAVYSLKGTPLELNTCHLPNLDIQNTRWEKDGQDFSSQCSVVLSEAGNYKLNLTTVQGCELTHQFYVINSTSIAKGLSECTIKIAPNPTTGKYKLLFDLDQRRDVTIRITNVYGALVELSEVPLVQSQVLERELRTPGVYFITIVSENHVLLTGKLIVQ